VALWTSRENSLEASKTVSKDKKNRKIKITSRTRVFFFDGDDNDVMVVMMMMMVVIMLVNIVVV
jgi:hypothetical protein